jgi:hypothetical protein
MPTDALCNAKIVSWSATGIIHTPFHVCFEFVPCTIGFLKGGKQASSIQFALPDIDHIVYGSDQSVDHVANDGKLLAEFTFRPLGKLSTIIQVLARFRGFHKKHRFIDHVFTDFAVRSLVVLEENKQLSR